MLACACDRPKAGRNSAYTRAYGNASFRAFEGGYLFFKYGGGGVAETGINITAFFACKASTALFAIFKIKSRIPLMILWREYVLYNIIK